MELIFSEFLRAVEALDPRDDPAHVMHGDDWAGAFGSSYVPPYSDVKLAKPSTKRNMNGQTDIAPTQIKPNPNKSLLTNKLDDLEFRVNRIEKKVLG